MSKRKANGKAIPVPPRERDHPTAGVLRDGPDLNSTPIGAETFDRLVAALERVYPGKVRRAVEVCPVAIVKTIDNESDALETIRRIEERTTAPHAFKPSPGIDLADESLMMPCATCGKWKGNHP